MKRFIKEYWIELTLFAIALVGVFLLVERINIRETVSYSITYLTRGLSDLISGWINAFVKTITGFTVSDLLGWVLLLFTIAFIGWRFRWRFVRSEWYVGENCPRCNSPLVRAHRTWKDRLLSRVFFLPLHRYRCSDPDCGWTGARKPGRHRKRRVEAPIDV